MSYYRSVSGLMVAACALLAFAGQASGQGMAECRVGCNAEKRECVSTARVAALACKETCRAEVEPTELGACKHTCMETFRNEKSTCRDQHSSCRDGCKASQPDDDDGSTSDDGGLPPDKEAKKCAADCRKDLASCGRDAARQSKDCVKGCKTAADRAACLQGCATAAQGGTSCVPAFETCVAGCAPSPEPETPTGGAGEG